MESVFVEFQRLNGTTWFYLSLLLTIALYFRFTRFFSLRNLDLFLLFLIVPGLLAVKLTPREPENTANGDGWSLIQLGYLWLFAVTGLFLVRALGDLFLERRPRLEPNLNLAGLAFLAISLFGFLTYEVIQKEPDPQSRQGARVASSLWRGGIQDEIEPADPATILMMGPVVAVHGTVAERAEQNAPVTPSDVEIGVSRSTAILCQLLIVAALLLIGWRHFDSPATGMGLATLYLLLPITAIDVEKTNHLLPSLFLVWSVYFYKRPAIAGILMGLASTFVFPLFLLPAWTGFYWQRGARWFLMSFCLVAVTFFIGAWFFEPLWSFVVQQTTSLAWHAWENPEEPNLVGFWTKSTQVYRGPIFLLFLILVVGSAIWPKDKNLAELIALSVAIILSVQFWYNDRGGSYVLWYLPLLLLMIYRPNLADVRPPQHTAKGAATT